MATHNKPTTIQAKTEAFFKTVEAGDMTLFQIIPKAIAVFGYTRAGKTTSCHLLCRSPLKAIQEKGELIYMPSTNKFYSAIVGITHESETQIPNIFDTILKEGNTLANVVVLDQPGYGDTYGFHRIFSNGYFHYRTFSKTPKLKFVLAVWMNDMRGTAQKFKNTIKNFINTFNDWEAIKTSVLKATCLLITKADLQTTQASLLDILKTLREAVCSMGSKQKVRYQQFIDDIISQKKVFYISKPAQLNQKAEDNTTLQKIYDKTQFWQRQINKNIVNMDQVNFSVAQEILLKLRDTSDELFREEFVHYLQFTQKRTNDMILTHQGSLKSIVQLLSSDAKSSNESHTFLDAMAGFNKKYYEFYQTYGKKRDLIIANLFRNAEAQSLKQSNVSLQSQLKEMRSVYFIKKFKVLEFLLFIFNNLKISNETSRSIEELEVFSSSFMQIFKKFSILGINKNDKESIIYKYSYIIQRLIEQSKIITLIMFKTDALKHEFSLLDIKFDDIFRTLYDKFFTAVLGQIDCNEIKRQFIQNMDFSLLSSVNDEIIEFFESIPEKVPAIKFKIAESIIQLEKKLFQDEKNPEEQRKTYLLKKLYLYRNDFFAFWINLKKQGTVQMREKCSQTLLNLTKSLATVLQHMGLYSHAKDCYRTINDAESIFKLYQLQSTRIHKDRYLYRQLLISYALDADIYYRRQLALQCLQKAYSLSSTIAEIREVSQKIVDLTTSKKEDASSDPYLSRMYNFDEIFFEDLPEDLKATIEEEGAKFDAVK